MSGVSASFRLNQAIAKSGLCSRRDADRLIRSGRVCLNGEVIRDFNQTVNPATDTLTVDGKTVHIAKFVYILMYKPPGVVTTCADEKNRQDVMDLLPPRLRHLRPVGRLDLNSEGLLLFTNDGELTQKVTHPMHHLSKLYLVTVKNRIRDRDLKLLSSGIDLADGRTLPAKVRLITRSSRESTFQINLMEGRNRQIRRMCAHLGYSVSRLVRVGIGEIQLGQMTPGAWRYLTHDELRVLKFGSKPTLQHRTETKVSP